MAAILSRPQCVYSKTADVQHAVEVVPLDRVFITINLKSNC